MMGDGFEDFTLDTEEQSPPESPELTPDNPAVDNPVNFNQSEPGSGVMEVIAARLSDITTPIAKGFARLSYPGYFEKDEGFSLAEKLDESVKNGEISEEDRKYFNEAENDYQFQEIREVVRRENWSRQTRENSNWAQNIAGEMIAFPFNPINFPLAAIPIPLNNPILRTAAQAALFAGGETGARYLTSQTVSKEEIAAAAVGGAIFGGLLGGIQSGITRGTFQKWSKSLGNYLTDSDPYRVLELKGQYLYTKVWEPTKGFVSEKVAEPVAAFLNSSPYLTALRLKDAKIRSIFHSMFRNNQIITEEMRAGKTPGLSAEGQTAIKTKEWLELTDEYDHIAAQAIKNGYETAQDFNLDVSRYIRNTLLKRGEETIEFKYMGKTPYSPEAKEAGDKIIRFWADILDDGMKYDVIPTNYEGAQGVKANAPVLVKNEAAMTQEEFLSSQKSWDNTALTAWGHFTRIYDKEKVLANKAELEDLLIKANFKKYPTLSEKRIRKLAADQYRHITGTDFSDRYAVDGFDFRATIGGNFVKERHVNVSDELLEPFLVNNPLEVGDQMVRRLAGATQLNRIAKEHGYKNWKGLLDGVNKSRSSFGMPEAEAVKYDAETAKIRRDLEDGADLIMGNYRNRWDNPTLQKAAQGIKWYNRVTQLGGVLISSIPDISIVILRHGLGKTTSRTLNELFSNTKIYDVQAMKKAMTAGEVMANMGRVIDETYTRGGMRAIRGIEKKFHSATLLPRWNDFWKRVSSTLHYDSILEASLRNNEADRLFLRQNRISAAARSKIVELFNSGKGYEHGGLKFLPLDRITDKPLRNTLWEALQTAADETVITPGAADVPKVLRGSIGSALLQYKSFITAYHTNVIVPILRQAESREHLAAYITSSIALGAVTVDLKERSAGRKPDYESANYWTEVLKRSGLLSFLPDVWNAVYGTLRRGDITQISAPIQTVNKVIRAGKNLLGKRKMTEKQTREAAGLFTNLFYLKSLIIDPALRKEAESGGRRLVKGYSFLGIGD
jgi:hypothetical protein